MSQKQWIVIIELIGLIVLFYILVNEVLPNLIG